MNDLPNDPLMPGAPVRPSISEAIATLRSQKPMPVKADDPAPSPMKLHQEKLEGMVRAATATALDMGRQMRDEVDELLKGISEESERQLEQVAAFIGKTEGVNANLKVMRDALSEASKLVASPTIINPPKRNSGGKS